jgi:hypothetical protein
MKTNKSQIVDLECRASRTIGQKAKGNSAQSWFRQLAESKMSLTVVTSALNEAAEPHPCTRSQPFPPTDR